MSAVTEVLAQFPWLSQLGLSEAWLQDKIADGVVGDALVGAVRQTVQYKERFPAIVRPDGTLRMSERQYLQTEDQYRALLRNYGNDRVGPRSGIGGERDPAVFARFIENDISPDELSSRLQTYERVRAGGRELRDAFYVYAGLRVTDDELYEAVVDPVAATELSNRYNQSVAAQPLDYETFITRAAQAGLERVVETLQDLERQGVVTGEAIQRVREIDPQFAAEVTGLLYHGGKFEGRTGMFGPGKSFLSLPELTEAFQFAVVGAAASAQGLRLPTGELLKQMRDAGVSRAQANKVYGEFARDRELLKGEVQRLRGSGFRFGLRDFEKAKFLSSASEEQLLQQAAAREAAQGAATGFGNFGFDRTGGRVVQRGLRRPAS